MTWSKHSIKRPCDVCNAPTNYFVKTQGRRKEAGVEIAVTFREWRCLDHAPRLYAHLQQQAEK